MNAKDLKSSTLDAQRFPGPGKISATTKALHALHACAAGL